MGERRREIWEEREEGEEREVSEECEGERKCCRGRGKNRRKDLGE